MDADMDENVSVSHYALDFWFMSLVLVWTKAFTPSIITVKLKKDQALNVYVFCYFLNQGKLFYLIILWITPDSQQNIAKDKFLPH